MSLLLDIVHKLQVEVFINIYCTLLIKKKHKLKTIFFLIIPPIMSDALQQKHVLILRFLNQVKTKIKIKIKTKIK